MTDITILGRHALEKAPWYDLSVFRRNLHNFASLISSDSKLEVYTEALSFGDCSHMVCQVYT